MNYVLQPVFPGRAQPGEKNQNNRTPPPHHHPNKKSKKTWAQRGKSSTLPTTCKTSRIMFYGPFFPAGHSPEKQKRPKNMRFKKNTSYIAACFCLAERSPENRNAEQNIVQKEELFCWPVFPAGAARKIEMPRKIYIVQKRSYFLGPFPLPSAARKIQTPKKT